MPEQKTIDLEPGWLKALEGEFSKPYFTELRAFLQREKSGGAVVYPPGNRIFAAFNRTPFDKVKVVIIGQDPYHGAGQANGLSFSVSPGISIPPSLRNIYKELATDTGFVHPGHGNLEHWADQGVLMLNATLTVRASQPGSHQGKGWETFTDEAIRSLSRLRSGLVFLLWGSFAQSKAPLIDQNKHLMLTAPHPSPFSADRGFFGCRHFSQTNEWLQKMGTPPVDWQIPSVL